MRKNKANEYVIGVRLIVSNIKVVGHTIKNAINTARTYILLLISVIIGTYIYLINKVDTNHVTSRLMYDPSDLTLAVILSILVIASLYGITRIVIPKDLHTSSDNLLNSIVGDNTSITNDAYITMLMLPPITSETNGIMQHTVKVMKEIRSITLLATALSTLSVITMTIMWIVFPYTKTQISIGIAVIQLVTILALLIIAIAESDIIMRYHELSENITRSTIEILSKIESSFDKPKPRRKSNGESKRKKK